MTVGCLGNYERGSRVIPMAVALNMSAVDAKLKPYGVV